ncbi:DNA cytosine methyltransferase [Mesorhizobium sp. ESP7-2]|uniref:DNA cytosine methyltransferase n=1 Tax=Mesorhizobium sp. ESP7-2 TaxID=2876622 RepID=UPI001CC9D4C6|nr:DNA cytosine methyltransferase [Mesorhizobium sp. ESP7-2]
MTAYYNEYDAAAAAILQQQIDDGVIAPGVVDTRSIKEVQFDDIRGYTQYHWFAGGGLWSVAARRAGWHDDRPIWSASCPCQPFSAAGKGAGTDDPRHLWPDLLRLIRAARAAGDGPVVLVGEQVSGAAGYGWFDGVRADLAAEDYASRARDFPACAVDAPHQRNRLYWCAVADAIGGERDGRSIVTERRPQGRDASFGADAGSGGADLVDASRIGRGEGRPEPVVHGGRPAVAGADASSVTLGDAERAGLEGQPGHGDDGGRSEPGRSIASSDDAGTASNVADSGGGSLRDVGRSAPAGAATEIRGEVREQRFRADARPDDHGRNGTYWSDAEWIICHDGKARRAKPGLRLLVDGLPGRVDLWRVGGNAIVPEAAVEVIAALRETLDAERLRLTGAFA